MTGGGGPAVDRVTAAGSERDQRPGDRLLTGQDEADLPRTSTGKVRRLDLPEVLGPAGG
jgi:hypothetical protein